MADRIKNYQQEADQITTLKAIRTDLGVTPSSYTPDATVVTKDRVVTFAQAEEELVVLSDIEKGVKQQVTEVDIAQKDVANIKALLQGHLYYYQTDSTSAYTKTVPSGAMPYAGLEQIGGKTIVMNQLESNPTTVYTSDGSHAFIAGTKFYAGHKYYMRCTVEGTGTNNTGASVYTKQSGSNRNIVVANGGNNYHNVIESQFDATSDGTKIGNEGNCWVYVYLDGADSVTNIQIVDLTLMFGSGNEPSTVAEFESMFPADYYEYNAGTLLSAGVTSIFSEGQNLINPANFTTSGVSFADGVITVQTASGKNYRDIYTGSSYTGTAVPVAYIPKLPFLMPGTYTFVMDSYTVGEFRLSVYSVAENGSVTQVGSIGTSGLTLTFDKPTRITIRSRFSSTITNLRLTKTASVVPYKPYFSETYPIPAEIRALEGYGWSCPDHYNYIDYEAKKYVQEVGSREYASGDESDSTVITDGTTTYYPLTTAVETDISEYLTDDNLIQVESGGTLTFPNSTGDDYQIPVPSEEEYMIDLQEAINNG